MDKKLLVERVNSSLEYTSEPATKSGCLGHLAGIGADYNKPTRNGRRYPKDLWEGVMASDDYKEGMETHTIFAENDHPETRVDTSIKEISAVLTNMEIRGDGTVWTEFDILDTPQGRILKNLIDYGSKIGVSSRGLGDEVVRDGETIIDPKTYVFYGFDMVVMPAVKSARPDVVESVERKKISESFSREIENAGSAAELESIRHIAEAANVPDLDSIKESINIKLNSYSANGDDISGSSAMSEDLGNLARHNEVLMLKMARLESVISANNVRDKKMRAIVKETSRNSRRLSKSLQESIHEASSLREELYDSSVQLEESQKRFSSLSDSSSSKIKSLQSKVTSLSESLRKSREAESTSNETIRSLESKVAELTRANKVLESRVASSDSSKSLMEKNLRSSNDDMKKKLSMCVESLNNVTSKYIKTRCAQEGISVDTLVHSLPKNYTISDVDKKLSELSDRKRRFDKLPIAIRSVPVRLEESVGSNPEDDQTMRILNRSLK